LGGYKSTSCPRSPSRSRQRPSSRRATRRSVEALDARSHDGANCRPGIFRVYLGSRRHLSGYLRTKIVKAILAGGDPAGVTIGVGYDLGVTIADRFEADWGSALPKETMTRLKQAIGVKGSTAKSLVETLKDIEVPFSTARQVFLETAVPRFYHLMTSTFPGASELPFACQGALLSLVYNRGSSLEGERRIHMRRIRDAIVTDKLEDVPFQLRAMKELGGVSGMSGIVKRREGEALMCEKAFRLRERVLQVLARQK
jgi:hypothetical protein